MKAFGAAAFPTAAAALLLFLPEPSYSGLPDRFFGGCAITNSMRQIE